MVFLRSRWAALSAALALSACAVTAPDYKTASGRKTIVWAVNSALTSGNCGSAYDALLPWYDSDYSDNEARFLMASVYGCYTGINVMTLLGALATNPSAMSGAGFWRFLTQYFPSTTAASDRKLETALFGIDAAQSALQASIVLNPLYTVNSAGYNPRSLVTSDRMEDMNFYLTFLGMAGMGAIQNRYGSPDASYIKTVDLPGETAVTVTSVSCKYAAAMINFMDGVHSAAESSSGPIGSTLVQLDEAFTTLISQSCDAGCQGTAPPFGGVVSGCALSACAGCPTAMRNTEAVCAGLATDENSCATAGLINFINNSPLGWN